MQIVSHLPTQAPGDATAEVVRRFIAAFQDKDAAAIRALVAPDCVMEAIQPAPDGLRVDGYEANVAFWQAMVADPTGPSRPRTWSSPVIGDQPMALPLRRGRPKLGARRDPHPGPRRQDRRGARVRQDTGGRGPGPGEPDHVRGRSAIQRGFPGARPVRAPGARCRGLRRQNSSPAPSGSRHVGREACVALWRRIATNPGTQFDLEEVVISGERATIRWRLRWGADESSSSARGEPDAACGMARSWRRSATSRAHDGCLSRPDRRPSGAQ